MTAMSEFSRGDSDPIGKVSAQDQGPQAQLTFCFQLESPHQENYNHVGAVAELGMGVGTRPEDYYGSVK